MIDRAGGISLTEGTNDAGENMTTNPKHDFALVDGRAVPLSGGLPEGVYLYQRMRTIDGRALHLDAHLVVLSEGARALFGRIWRPQKAQIAAEIAELLRLNGYPAGGAVVTLRLHADGTRLLMADGVSLYREYALRSLRPTAVVVPCSCYRAEWPTSARYETVRWARTEARRRGAHVALWCDADGVLQRADDAPLFAVRDDVIHAACDAAEVERQLVLKAARKAGLQVVDRPVEAALLDRYDELFAFDCEGVSAVASCGDRLYLSLVAERVAGALAACGGTDFPEK